MSKRHDFSFLRNISKLNSGVILSIEEHCYLCVDVMDLKRSSVIF